MSKLSEARLSFDQWKEQYAQRIKLIAGLRTIEAARDELPHDDILREQWVAGDEANEAADEEMSQWEE